MQTALPWWRLYKTVYRGVCCAQGDVPQLPSIVPGEPSQPASTPGYTVKSGSPPVAALTEATDAIHSTWIPGYPVGKADPSVAALTEAADAIHRSWIPGYPVGSAPASSSAPPSTGTAPASPGGSSAGLSEPAGSSASSAPTQQAALQSGAGSVTSQQGQGWLRAMWNRQATLFLLPSCSGRTLDCNCRRQ